MAWCGCAAGAGEHHAPAAAALLARAQPGRVGVVVHEGALSITATAQRLRRHRRRRLQGLEPPPRRDRPYHLVVLTPMDHAGQTLGALVSHVRGATRLGGARISARRTVSKQWHMSK